MEKDQIKNLTILILKPLNCYCSCACAMLLINSVHLIISTNNGADVRVFHISLLYKKMGILKFVTIVSPFRKRK